MREILFRGKATNRDPNRQYRTTYKNGDWVYGLITDMENYMGFAEMTNEAGVSGIDVDKNTVGQYTGLKDKNGKKIFEGDIVRVLLHGKPQPVGIVKYRERGICLYTVVTEVPYSSYLLDNPENFEVIGNIHDNPELLKNG